MDISPMGTAPATDDRLPVFVGVVDMISSTYVFQAPQEGHLPSHLEDSAPQFWQNQAFLTLLIIQS